MIYSQWNIPRSKPVIPDALTRAGFSRLLAAVLAVRYDSPEEARQFPLPFPLDAPAEI